MAASEVGAEVVEAEDVASVEPFCAPCPLAGMAQSMARQRTQTELKPFRVITVDLIPG